MLQSGMNVLKEGDDEKGVKISKLILILYLIILSIIFEFPEVSSVSSTSVNTCHQVVVLWKSKKKKKLFTNVTKDTF